MGAGGFHGRVRDGIGCGHPAMATRSPQPRPALTGGCVGRGQALVRVEGCVRCAGCVRQRGWLLCMGGGAAMPHRVTRQVPRQGSSRSGD